MFSMEELLSKKNQKEAMQFLKTKKIQLVRMGCHCQNLTNIGKSMAMQFVVN